MVAGFRVSGFGLLGSGFWFLLSPVVRVLVPGLGPRPGAKSDNRNYQVPADEADKQITDNTTLVSGGGTSLGSVDLVSQRVFIKSICKSRLPHKSVNNILYYYYCKE